MSGQAMGQVAQIADYRRRRAGLDAEVSLTKKELARALHVSERTIERWQLDPEFPVERWGPRLRRYYLSQVRAYLSRL